MARASRGQGLEVAGRWFALTGADPRGELVELPPGDHLLVFQEANLPQDHSIDRRAATQGNHDSHAARDAHLREVFGSRNVPSGTNFHAASWGE
jgi:hypothetical protein